MATHITSQVDHLRSVLTVAFRDLSAATVLSVVAEAQAKASGTDPLEAQRVALQKARWRE